MAKKAEGSKPYKWDFFQNGLTEVDLDFHPEPGKKLRKTFNIFSHFETCKQLITDSLTAYKKYTPDVRSSEDIGT